MSFDRTIAGIDSIKQQDTISVEELYGLIICVLDDAYEVAGTEGIAELHIDDATSYARKMNRIASALTNSFEAKRNYLETERESLKERCKAHAEEILSIQEELASINTDILKTEEKKEELNSKRNQLQIERGHLLTAAEENERLQKEIDRLSDPNLDKIAEENKQLEADVIVRRNKETELLSIKESLTNGVNEIVAKINTLETEIAELKEQETLQKEREDDAKLIKVGYEKGIENIKNSIVEIQDWIKNVSETQGKLNEERVELQNHVNELVVAWNAFSRGEQGARILNKEEYLEISKWFEEKIVSINVSLKEIEERYKTLVGISENLTK